jgi:hypothetical protein
VLLIVEVGVWRDVKVVGVGDVVRGLFARALVWGDVDPHCSGLVAREANVCGIVIKVRNCARCSRVGSGRASP